ncbi:M50 family metallopeptidase [Cellulomonas xylanilytica]|uniref:Membrane protein n=1 Tax=Cellulomonas xylanilytica TaxID=233583 RepID=A0A510V7W7_9CELL|nr:M50 family metallopeptidase [Cellulomonas xylanilytica]GEK22967.1 membrane protein [Cellulomonas xylanilytica]
MDWIGDAWQDITTPQPVPSSTAVLLTAAGVLLVLLVPAAWHVARHGLTIVHEAAHAAVAVLVGRRLSGIRVHSDTSGLTVSVGKPRGPGMVATVAAGYTGPALLGVGAAWLLSRGYAVALLWILLVVLVLVLVQIRNWYGLWAVLVTGALLVAVTVWGSATVQSVAAYAMTWFLLLGAPRAVLEMQSERRRGRRRGVPDASDAGLLGRLTHTPGALWVAVLLLVCLAALALGAVWLIGLQV